jgi:hypothetical protein
MSIAVFNSATCFGPIDGPLSAVHIHNKNVSMYVSDFCSLTDLSLSFTV